jgi:hypothetical protein
MTTDLPARQIALESLDALVGTWTMEAGFADGPSSGPMGQTVFEWLPGRQFLAQRWEARTRTLPTESRSSVSPRTGLGLPSTTLIHAASPASTQ